MTELRTIIVEDEVGAADHLSSLLSTSRRKIEILAYLKSVDEAVDWVTSNEQPDLAFFDIQLEDGLSFEIFKRCDISFPVIFTTAFDQYAIDAFKVNSIDYLLKPITESQLDFSLNKYAKMKGVTIDSAFMRKILNEMHPARREQTLLIHHRDTLIPITEGEFAYFYLMNGLVYGCTKDNQNFFMNQNIEQLGESLSSYLFFKANRQAIVNRSAILEAELYFNGRLSLKLTPQAKNQILISKARVPAFKEWLTGRQSNYDIF